FQVSGSLWTSDINDPKEVTSYIAYFPNIENMHSGWQSKKIDALFEESQEEVDPDKRAAQYARIQKLFVEAAPLFFLYEAPYCVALRKQVSGFWQTPLGNNLFEYARVSR